jgi:hypothetical protein
MDNWDGRVRPLCLCERQLRRLARWITWEMTTAMASEHSWILRGACCRGCGPRASTHSRYHYDNMHGHNQCIFRAQDLDWGFATSKPAGVVKQSLVGHLRQIGARLFQAAPSSSHLHEKVAAVTFSRNLLSLVNKRTKQQT